MIVCLMAWLWVVGMFSAKDKKGNTRGGKEEGQTELMALAFLGWV